ncbi:bifunctional nuclease family protein [Paeniglutamicibacter cryotolerans]|uniref:BFN domain-containing protein n=1 Tax=Paeniglutamicibacter cryotolerans TaxID=670079 RepID=A0A839QKC0_9MICC|nr:bifunctional nuclease family protein [Paeniglutamicibacter cryotolerans]MBB2996297.1 hypothetical protein [Paeniglutamicibacter cryotolerans]
MRELEIVGVRIELPSNQPLVLLKEVDGPRHLPIWIGAPEASAIAMSQQGIEPPRPMTHDLLINVLQALGKPLLRAELISVEDTIFKASLVFADGVSVDARASDAVALVLRAGCPLLCAEEVLADAGVLVGNGGESVDGEEERIREFREFLDDVEPEDFET